MNSNIEFGYMDGRSACMIYYKGMTFYGSATCHPDDKDFESERTGLCIAEARANIQLMRFKRDFEIKPQLKILKHLYNNIKQSKNYNPISHENKMLRRQIQTIENQLTAINNDLAGEKQSLKEYIQQKDKLYNKLRAKKQ